MGHLKVVVVLVALASAFPAVSGTHPAECTDGYTDTTSGNTDTSAIEVPPFGATPVGPMFYVTANLGGSGVPVALYQETNDVDRLQTGPRYERFNDCDDETHPIYGPDTRIVPTP